MANTVSVTIAVRRMSSEVLMRGVRSRFMLLTPSSPPAPVGTRFAARLRVPIARRKAYHCGALSSFPKGL